MKAKIKKVLIEGLIIGLLSIITPAIMGGVSYLVDAESILRALVVLNFVNIGYKFYKVNGESIKLSIFSALLSPIFAAVFALTAFILIRFVGDFIS